MNLSTELKGIIDKFGIDILINPNFMNFLADFGITKQFPFIAPIIKDLLANYGVKIVAQFKSKDTEALKRTLMHCRNKYISDATYNNNNLILVIDSLANAVGISLPIIDTHTDKHIVQEMQFTIFTLNTADYLGYEEPTTNITRKLLGQVWNLFAEGEKPQTLLFSDANQVLLMNKGRGLSGYYSLKNDNSILLSFGDEGYYMDCVYNNKDIIIFKFNQSNNHILLSRKDIIFYSVEEIRSYLANVRQQIDLKREEERKRKAIEQENHVKALIEDICRTGEEASDKRVESLKCKLKELSSIIGIQKASKYQSYVDNAIKENQERKDRIAEEIRKEQEEWKKQKEIKKEKYLKRCAVFAVSILFICIWTIAISLHLNDKWEQCDDVLGVSAFIFFLSILPSIGLLIKYKKALIVYLFFGCLTIISAFIYNEDKIKFRSCFWTYLSDDNYSEDCFSLEHGDSYLSESKYHLFDSQVKRLIKRRINSSYDLGELNQYLHVNNSGFYVNETEKRLYSATDTLCSQAKTLGDWRYLIYNAPQKYKTVAEKNYTQLDSFVWDDEKLAYENAKSLNSIEAYDKYLSRYLNNNSHRHEIEQLRFELQKLIDMERKVTKSIKK